MPDVELLLDDLQVLLQDRLIELEIEISDTVDELTILPVPTGEVDTTKQDLVSKLRRLAYKKFVVQTELTFKNSILNPGLLLEPPSATAFLTDQGSDTPATIIITTQNELTDLSVTGAWSIGVDHPLFTLVDNNTGELQYDGLVSRIFTIHYSLTLGVTNSFEHVFASIMRTPDAGVKAEIPESRMYLETINGSDGMPLSNSITFKLDPLDKIKINGANADGMINLAVTIATMAIK